MEIRARLQAILAMVVIAKPRSVKTCTKFEAEIYVLTKDEGGRPTTFISNYRPQFYLRTPDVTRKVDLLESIRWLCVETMSRLLLNLLHQLFLNQVFYKDGGSSQKHTLIVDAAPGSDSGRGTQISGSAFSLEQGPEGFSYVIRRNTNNNNQSMCIDDEQENVNPVSSIGQQCSKTSKEGTHQIILTDEEMLTEAYVIESHGNVTRLTGGINNGQPAVSASLPLWTVEQLDELLDDDFDEVM